MSKVYLITEGQSDQEMLRKLLPEDIVQNTEFVVGNGRYSAQSLARSILAAARMPVALVLDADTIDPSAVQEQRDFLKEALGQVSAGVPFEIFLAVPELEVLLVESPDFLHKLSPRDYSSDELELAKLRPKRFLQRLIGQQDRKQVIREIVRKLDTKAVSALRKHPFLQGLSQFLSSTLQPAN